ncbi:hypothetical protein RSE69_004010 [Yersinia enterocolitica]|nr:hypothetical protein [Yersinia enterocolitica]EKN6013213.1 hypothetical protein [Yersinia enterocolitica]ELI7993880.1 hypothetical protein [Yersinia enterocolitica]
MSKITYPCETGAIFHDVIFVINPRNSSELLGEADRAAEFFLDYFPYATLENIREEIVYSFGGLYLNDFKLIREAA